MGNDYIKGFANGLGGGVDSTTKTPWLLQPLLHNSVKYKNMILTSVCRNSSPRDFHKHSNQQHVGESEREKRDLCFRKYAIRINEELFTEYAQECYYYKHRGTKAIEKTLTKAIFLANVKLPRDDNRVTVDTMYKDDETLALAIRCIRNHLSKGSAKNKMMDEGEIMGYCRRLYWLLDYWSNSYLESCDFPDPCQKDYVEGKSIYGWETPNDDPKACIYTNAVCSTESDVTHCIRAGYYYKDKGSVESFTREKEEDVVIEKVKNSDSYPDKQKDLRVSQGEKQKPQLNFNASGDDDNITLGKIPHTERREEEEQQLVPPPPPPTTSPRPPTITTTQTTKTTKRKRTRSAVGEKQLATESVIIINPSTASLPSEQEKEEEEKEEEDKQQQPPPKKRKNTTTRKKRTTSTNTKKQRGRSSNKTTQDQEGQQELNIFKLMEEAEKMMHPS